MLGIIVQDEQGEKQFGMQEAEAESNKKKFESYYKLAYVELYVLQGIKMDAYFSAPMQHMKCMLNPLKPQSRRYIIIPQA